MKKRGRHGARIAAASEQYQEDDLLRACELSLGAPLTFPRKLARNRGETIPSVGQSAVGPFPAMSQKQKRIAKQQTVRNEKRDEEEEEEARWEDEEEAAEPQKSGRGKERNRGNATRREDEKKMRSIGDSPQSQPGHVDLPIPRWA